MQYHFSDRVKALKPSEIREILKAASVPGMIPFAAGNPAPEAFPAKAVQEILQSIMHNQPEKALQYGVTEGYEPLRTAVGQYMKTDYRIGKPFDALLITAGAQQVMDLTTKVLCNEGDTVICENPSFIGSLNCFRSYNVNLVGIDMQPDGMDLEQLEQALKTQPNVRFIYTIPNFQNPTGITMSLEKRQAVYALAKQYGVLILEDNPYGELRVQGEGLPAIKSMDDEGIVIYAGSFSKILAPGIRVGFAIAPEPLLAKMTVGKQTSDVHTPMLSQMLVHEWMTNYDFRGHITNIREIYRRKMDLMCDRIDNECRGFLQYRKPEGGLFIWATLPENIPVLAFCEKATRRMVAVVPGTAFLTQAGKPCHAIRLNFSTPADSKIMDGMKVLGALSAEYRAGAVQ